MDTKHYKNESDEEVLNFRRFCLTWVTTGLLIYAVLSGLLIWLLPFGRFTQMTVLVHALVGLLFTLPLSWIVYGHWHRRRASIGGAQLTIALLAAGTLAICLMTGLYAIWNGTVGGIPLRLAGQLHFLCGLLLGVTLLTHLLPVVARQRKSPTTNRRPARRLLVPLSALLVVVLLSASILLDRTSGEATKIFSPLADDYALPFGDERPFWPSRAEISAPEWSTESLTQDGVLSLDAYPRADSCGSAGCHNEIYTEWRPSAHGFAAEDALFLRVQELLAKSQSAAETRSCAGCHDPLALLAGTRDGSSIVGDALYRHDGVSCVACHSITTTTTDGNGSYHLSAPRPYLFADSDNVLGQGMHRFLIRRYSEQHNVDYGRTLYKESEFCAACHKQVPTPGTETDVGLAQEQNEYDSWKNGRWYHPDDPAKTIECGECHMPLVASDDPASGDLEAGKHRSHRALASNMYIPLLQSLPGGDEQARQTIAWLRGEIDIPEIESKWVTGPVVNIEITAPEHIAPGELVNIVLFLHNNKTGHDFPAGPLDLLESWVELTVVDNLGRTLLLLGDETTESPALDAPIVYKADWYDKRGLPVQTHSLWDAVGASYKNSLQSGDVEIAEIQFRCPAIARPRISGSYSETGPGERKTDVVFSIDNAEIKELKITARLLFRKANPEFLRRVFDVDEEIAAPVIELTSTEHLITVSSADISTP